MVSENGPFAPSANSARTAGKVGAAPPKLRVFVLKCGLVDVLYPGRFLRSLSRSLAGRTRVEAASGLSRLVTGAVGELNGDRLLANKPSNLVPQKRIREDYNQICG